MPRKKPPDSTNAQPPTLGNVRSAKPTTQANITVNNYTIPLRALTRSDASHAEIVSRLRLNFAIRCLLDAIREADCAGAS